METTLSRILRSLRQSIESLKGMLETNRCSPDKADQEELEVMQEQYTDLSKLSKNPSEVAIDQYNKKWGSNIKLQDLRLPTKLYLEVTPEQLYNAIMHDEVQATSLPTEQKPNPPKHPITLTLDQSAAGITNLRTLLPHIITANILAPSNVEHGTTILIKLLEGKGVPVTRHFHKLTYINIFKAL